MRRRVRCMSVFCVQLLPVPVCVADRFGSIRLELVRRLGTVIEIEFAIDDLESLRVYAGNLASCR